MKCLSCSSNVMPFCYCFRASCLRMMDDQQGVSSKEQSKDLLGSSSSLGSVVQLCQEDNMSEI